MAALSLIILISLNIASAGEFNGTTYRLTAEQLVVTQPIDASRLNLTLPEKAVNISLLDFAGRNAGFKESYTFWKGDYIYSLKFDKHILGKLVYILPHSGQKLILPLTENKDIRIILPPGYTTGDRFFGIATPDPDSIKTDKDVAELTWLNASADEVISVSYYKSSAPEIVKIVFMMVAVASLVLLAEYYVSIRRLRAVRKKGEGDMKY